MGPRRSRFANKAETTTVTTEANNQSSNLQNEPVSSDKCAEEKPTLSDEKPRTLDTSSEKQSEPLAIPATTGLKEGLRFEVFKDDPEALERANKRIRRSQYLGSNQPDPEDWSQLNACIRVFCDYHFKGISWDELDEPTKKRFNDWAPDARRLFNSKILSASSLFFQSWVWRILDKHIFANKTHELIRWKHPFYKLHNDLRLHLLENDSDLPNKDGVTEMWHHWNWATTALFSASVKHDPFAFDPAMLPSCIEDVLRREMIPHFPKSLGKYQQRALTCLVESAANVEVQYSISVADVRLRFWHFVTEIQYNFPADSSDIELVLGLFDYEDSLATRLVELVVAPAVEWRGMNGYDYDKFDIICKMKVVPSLDEKEAHEKEEEEQEEGDKEKEEERCEREGTEDKDDGDEDVIEKEKDSGDGETEGSGTQSNADETESKAG